MFQDGALLTFCDHKRAIEKRLLNLAPGRPVLDPVLLCIALIPLETTALREVIHDYRPNQCIRRLYTKIKGDYSD
jgi:hypothetical protein